MKITKKRLNQIIKEEVRRALYENEVDIPPEAFEDVDPAAVEDLLSQEDAILSQFDGLQEGIEDEQQYDKWDKQSAAYDMDPAAETKLEKATARAGQLLGMNLQTIGVPLGVLGYKAFIALGVPAAIAILPGMTMSVLVSVIGLYLAREYVKKSSSARKSRPGYRSPVFQ